MRIAAAAVGRVERRAESAALRAFRLAGPVAVALLLWLGGCVHTLMPTPNVWVGRGAELWRDTPPPLRSGTVELLYATDRKLASGADPGAPLRYGDGRRSELAFGVCRVRIGDERSSWEELVELSTAPRRARAVPVVVTGLDELGLFPATPWPVVVVGDRTTPTPGIVEAHLAATEDLRGLVAARLAQTPVKDVYVYVHGFNNTFEDAALVAAEMWHFLGRRGVPVVYSWPSRGGFGLVNYNYDRESGEFTIFHLKRFLEAVAGTPGLERLHLVAHSRGCDVLTSALRELAIRYRGEEPDDYDVLVRRLRLGQVVLAAPDMDLEVARQRIAAEQLGRAGERVTIYTSPHDLAIEVARWLFASAIRLGTLGLAQLPEDERLLLAQLPDLDLVDARVASGWIGHSYFYQNPAVSSDLITLLREGAAPGGEARPLVRRDELFWELRDGYPRAAVGE